MSLQTRAERRCIDCGEVQRLERRTVVYPQSGLDNVQLVNVPVWVCTNGHSEVVIPAMKELHDLLAHVVIRKPAPLNGAEIKFLRRRVDLTSREFAAHLGITAVSLSRLENGRRRPSRPHDLLIRLVAAMLIAAREGRPVPTDLAPFVDQLEQAWDIGTHRLRHIEEPLPEQEEWVEANAC